MPAVTPAKLGEIWVVDDDPSALAYAELALQHAGYQVRTWTRPVEALLACRRQLPSLVISDLDMPEMNGLELLGLIKQSWPQVPVILVTVQHEAATIVAAVKAGATNYLVKPIAPQALIAAVASALLRAVSRPGTEPAPPALEAVPEIVGTSPAILHVKRAILDAVRTDVNVLVTGETGTGKELVASALHRLSAPGQPFITYNCASTPTELFDATFFGHRRGAFTGADRDQPGLLLQAERGVLFLDEVECLSVAHQAKLLRVLDSGEVRPVGGERVRTISLRFVAATNRPPAEMIAARELREDFYYRLRGFEIALPSLRERLEDIPELAQRFLRDSGKVLTPDAEEALMRAAWPGNVRQLRNVLRAACGRTESNVIEVFHLDLPSRAPASLVPSSFTRARSAHPTPLPASAVRQSGEVAVPLQELERQAVVRAVAESGGNLARAAKALGIHRSTLRRKLKEWERND